MEQLVMLYFITYSFDNALHDTQLHNIKRWKENNLCDFSYFVACCAYIFSQHQLFPRDK